MKAEDLDRISDVISDAVNENDGIVDREELKETLNDILDEIFPAGAVDNEKRQALEEAKVYSVQVGLEGCMPDTSYLLSSSVNLAEALIDEMGQDRDSAEEGKDAEFEEIFRELREADPAALAKNGWRQRLPGSDNVISMIEISCAQALENADVNLFSAPENGPKA